MKTKKYTFSPQNGKPGHCVCAQVWDENGSHIATIKSTRVAKDASETAELFAKSLEMLDALKDEVEMLKIDKRCTPSKILKDGYSERIKRLESLLKELE